MGIKKKKIQLKDGRVCECVTIENKSGASIEILNLGGIIKSIYVPDCTGRLENIVLEYEDINTYIENPGYINAIIGRTAGRIHKGQITINDTLYQMGRNEGVHTLHGGTVGIDKKIWDIKRVDEEASSITLECTCGDMEEGYPGELHIEVTYTFTDDNELKISYKAKADKDTVVNLTNHAYFNLAGNAKTNIEEHILRVSADYICEIDQESIPTGKILKVEDEYAFNFKEAKAIGKDIEGGTIQLKLANGYDHPWILKGKGDVVELYDSVSGRRMTMITDQKAVVIYSMNYENPSQFTNGLQDIARYGICFEAQALPIGYGGKFKEDSILNKGQIYTQNTTYKFTQQKESVTKLDN